MSAEDVYEICPSCGGKAEYICPETGRCLAFVTDRDPNGCLQSSIEDVLDGVFCKLSKLGALGRAYANTIEDIVPHTDVIIEMTPELSREVDDQLDKLEREYNPDEYWAGVAADMECAP